MFKFFKRYFCECWIILSALLSCLCSLVISFCLKINIFDLMWLVALITGVMICLGYIIDMRFFNSFEDKINSKSEIIKLRPGVYTVERTINVNNSSYTIGVGAAGNASDVVRVLTDNNQSSFQQIGQTGIIHANAPTGLTGMVEDSVTTRRQEMRDIAQALGELRETSREKDNKEKMKQIKTKNRTEIKKQLIYKEV